MKKIIVLLLACLFMFFGCAKVPASSGETPTETSTIRDILKTEIIDGCLWITYSDAPDTPVNVGSVLYEDSASDCLLYRLNEDGETYSVVGIQNCMETRLVIPATYKQKPVTGIAEYAFKDCSFLKSITIPDSITNIGYGAFEDCSGVIQVENGVSYVGKWVVACDNDVRSVVLRNDTVGLGYGALTLGGAISITIPESVKYINTYALYSWASVKSITFEGTVAQWSAIRFDDEWHKGVSATEVVCSNGTVKLN